MALTATFTANFSSFYDAVDKADATLKTFGDGADRVGSRLNALGNQFSGQKVVQEATLMAKAVEEIGGVSALTDKELERLGATANEAVAKMRALGMDVPKNIQEIADKTKVANKETVDWMGALGKMAATMGIAFSVDTIVNFIGSVFDAAGAVKDLSDQWGVSTKAVQQWTQAARLSGVEQEAVGKSVQNLSQKIGEGSDEYKALLANVGLSYDELQKMPLENAYKEVIRAIGGIKDESLQLDVAQSLLGKSSKQMVGAIRDGFLEAADAQKVMSDTTIKRLEAAGDAWQTFHDKVIILSGEMLAGVMEASQTATKSWGRFFTTAAMGFRDVVMGSSGSVAAYLATQAALDDNATAQQKAQAATAQATDATGKNTNAVRTSAQVAADLAAKTKAAAKAQADHAAAVAASQKAQEDYSKAIAAQRDEIDALAFSFAGGGLIANATKYLKALDESIPVADMTAEKQAEINKVMLDAIDAYEAAGTSAPAAMYDIFIATRKVDEDTVQLTEDLRILGGTIDKGIKFPGNFLQLPPAPPASMFTGFASGITSALTGSILRAIEGGGSILQAAGSSIGNFLLDPKQSGVGKAITSAASKLPGLLGSAVSAAIPIAGSLIGPAVSWFAGKLTSWFGKSEAEKLRDQFVSAAGGIDALRESAAGAGTNLDALFKAKSADQMKAAIADLQSSFEFQATAIDAVNEAAQRYGFTLEELGPALARGELDKQAQQLYKDWEVLNSAGIDTVAITDRMSAAVSEYVQHASKMGLEIPDAMRPMLEAFAKSGDLLDDNGNAITDLEAAGISFSMTMSEGFKALIDQVAKLTDAISRSLGLAIENVPPLEVQGRVTWNVADLPTQNVSVGRGLLADANVPQFAGGTDGFQNFGAGTPVVLHGWEAVVPRDDAAAFATVTGTGAGPAGSTTPAIVINAQGAFFDTPESLQRLANKVSDALTAKYSVMGRLRAAVS